MKAFVSYCVAFVAVLLIVIGFGRLRNASPTKSVKNYIHISGCDTPDEPKGHKSDSIVFRPDATYHVKFSPAHSPTQGDLYPLPRNDNPADNEFDITPTGSNEFQLTGPNDCSKKGCYYRYTLRQIVNGTPEPVLCNDPGIHIVPGS